MKNVVITGATGVIGMALINKCIEENCHVTVIVNPESKRLDRIPEDQLVTIVKCGLNQYGQLTEYISGLHNGLINVREESADRNDCDNEHEAEHSSDNDFLRSDVFGISSDILKKKYDAFYHLAWAGTFGEARNDAMLQNKNIEYSLDAVRLAKVLGCKTFVGVGSQAEYGRVEGVLTADTPTNPENEYGKAKLKTSIETGKLCSRLGIKHIWTRVLSIYGPYDGENTMVTSTVNKLLKGIKPSFTKAEQMWDYLYSDDAAGALYLLGERGHDGKIYPIGSGKARPLKEYIEIIRDTINPSAELGFGEVPYSDKQVMYLCADLSELRADTGFEPRVDFEEGIKKYLKWIKYYV